MAPVILKLGNQGPDVRGLQLDLARLGYALKGTGYFGPATDVAVETFQRRSGLTVDGRVGDLTRQAIKLALDALKPGAGPSPEASHPQETGRPLWLEAALGLIGTKEGAGAKDNPVILEWARDEGGNIARDYKHDSIAWCALFANHALTRAGLKGTETLWALDFANPRKWPGVQLGAPAVGALAVMTRKTATGVAGHVTFVAGRDQAGNIMGVGGNQADAVNIKPFPLARIDRGFWWPIGAPAPATYGIATLPIIRSDGKISTNEA